MDFKVTYDDDAEQFREEVRNWIDANVPLVMKFPAETEELDDKTYKFAQGLRMKLAAKGWLYPTWPKELGGAGLSLQKRYVLEEELLRRGVPKVYDMAKLLGSAILIAGSEAQKKKFLPQIASGEVVVWQCFTEPQSGSDLAALQLKATRDGDDFILNGQKTFIGDGHHVDYLFSLAITDPEAPRHRNMSAFLVKANSAGITMTPLKPMALSRKNTIYFEDVKVPVDNLIGDLNHGWQVANASLDAERGGWGDWFRLDNLFIELIQYCKITKRNNCFIIDDPRIQDLLADLYLDVKAYNLLKSRFKWMELSGFPVTYEASQQSLYIKTLLPKFADIIMDVLGSQALLTDDPWTISNGRMEHFQRANLMTHGAGTPEILKLTIARAIGLPSVRR